MEGLAAGRRFGAGRSASSGAACHVSSPPTGSAETSIAPLVPQYEKFSGFVSNLCSRLLVRYPVQTMYMIKEAARLSGVSESSLRAWERRYRVVEPQRNPSGYRVYSPEDLAAVSTMRRLVEKGWPRQKAANAVRTGMSLPSRNRRSEGGRPAARTPPGDKSGHLQPPLPVRCNGLDTAGIEESLDAGFALGSFEYVVDSWLFPTLQMLGSGWAKWRGRRRRGARGQPCGPPTTLIGLRGGRQQVQGTRGRGRAALRKPA